MNENFDSQSLPVDLLQDELTSITKDLDTFIEKNSERSLEYMKFEAIERLANFIHQHKDMIEIARKLEENYLNDPQILALQTEVEWFDERVNYFEQMQVTDSEKLSSLQNQCKFLKESKRYLETELKNEKIEVNKLKKLLQSKKISSPLKNSLSPNFSSDLSLSNSSFLKSEKEKVEYLENASNKLKKTLKSVKFEIQQYKTQQFQSRQEILPLENFFQECFKSVYHLIFQRQAQLDDGQLSLAYKMFRENKMEMNEIKHKPLEATSGTHGHIVREALAGQNEMRNKNKKKKDFTWHEFKKLPTETVFIMISSKKVLKVLRSSLCSVGKTFITSESKSSVEQLEEFCKGYADKLKIRTDGKGNAI